MEDASVVGDLSPEDEARLIEELENARGEIKNMKMRQAMVRKRRRTRNRNSSRSDAAADTGYGRRYTPSLKISGTCVARSYVNRVRYYLCSFTCAP